MADVLAFGEPIDVSCPGVKGVPVIEADVELIVSFIPQFDWRFSYSCARFVLQRDSSSQLVWFRKHETNCMKLTSCLDTRERQMKENMANNDRAEPPYTSCLPTNF